MDEEAVGAKLQSFIDSGVLSKWSRRTYLDFEATGEESNAYNLTVAWKNIYGTEFIDH